MHAWYSAKQFKLVNDSNNMKHSYLYYKTHDDKIIQVTVVSNTRDHNCQYDDMEYLGEVKSFYKITEEPLILP